MIFIAAVPILAAGCKMTGTGEKETDEMTKAEPVPEGAEEIYFAGGCFWGTEKLFQGIDGVLDAESGYANGKKDIVPDYGKVCTGKTGYRETVRVLYDPKRVTLRQLLKAFFYVIDPTVKKRQGNDMGDQYQTGVYFSDEASGEIVQAYAEEEKKKYPVFAVEIGPLTGFFPAEEYHQDYLFKHPNGYCHIPPAEFDMVNEIIGKTADTVYSRPDDKTLRGKLSGLAYEVTQHGATERPFTGKYWDFDEKGIYVDVTTGEPLFSSLDKYESSCGWPSFTAPIDERNVKFLKDNSYGMKRTEVRSRYGNAHLGHVFKNDRESPSGTRYCINSAALEFIPYDEMEKRGYKDLLYLFETVT